MWGRMKVWMQVGLGQEIVYEAQEQREPRDSDR
jgi:hypothetical protein